jgi:hypothetical protein
LRINDQRIRLAIHEGVLPAVEADGKRWIDPVDMRRFQKMIGRGVRR